MSVLPPVQSWTGHPAGMLIAWGTGKKQEGLKSGRSWIAAGWLLTSIPSILILPPTAQQNQLIIISIEAANLGLAFSSDLPSTAPHRLTDGH